MADYSAALPQLEHPDILGQYLRGLSAPGQLQAQQQGLEEGQLNIDQLRLAVGTRQIDQDAYRQALQQQRMLPGGQPQQTQPLPPGSPGQPSAGAQLLSGVSGAQATPGAAQPAVGGSPFSSPSFAAAFALGHGRDPTDAFVRATEAGQKMAQYNAQPEIDHYDQIAAMGDPRAMVVRNPSDLQKWQQYAQARGWSPGSVNPVTGQYDPGKDFTADNVREAANYGANTLRGQTGQPIKSYGFNGTLKPGEAAFQDGREVASAPDAMTAYQRAELGIRQQEVNAKTGEGRRPQLVDVPQPDGTTQKQWIVPGHDSGLNVGAPEAAKPGMGMGRVQQAVAKITLAGNEVTKSAENLMQLGINTDSGWLGITNPQHGGILSSMKNALANNVSTQDTKSYAIMVSGVKRNLAAIEAAGNMPPGSLTSQMDQVELKPGDTQFNKLQRMAEIRQISEAGLESMLTLPGLTKPQIAQIQGINARMAKAIPFTQQDLLNLQQSKDPHATIADVASKQGLGNHPPEVQALLDKYK